MNRSLRLLIIENETKWADAIQTHLGRELGARRIATVVDVAASFEEAEKCIGAACEPYDLVSLDIHMGSHAAGDGLELLNRLRRKQAAWMVSILTGVEAALDLAADLGDDRAHVVQNELRSRAHRSFPPDRLLVLEKPKLKSPRLPVVLRQVCDILLHSLAGQNVFRRLVLNCQVPMHETTEGTWVRPDSADFKQAKKEGKLVTVGKRVKNASWFEDTVSLRQIRFGAGETITLEDGPAFETLEWLLRHPGEDFPANQIGGDNLEAVGNDWDDIDAETRREYLRQIARLKASLEDPAIPQAERRRLEEEIKAFQSELAKLRKGPVGGKAHEAIKKHKSRAIADMKLAGQLALAEHLEKHLRIEKGKFLYQPPQAMNWQI